MLTKQYYISYEKCTECIGFYDEPEWVPVCPSEAIVPDPDHQLTREELPAKKEHLDLVGR